MKLTYSDGGCTGGTCPTVYDTDHNTVVIQGYVLGGKSSGSRRSVVVPSELMAGNIGPGVRRISREAVRVTGRSVDPAVTTGLRDIAANEALVEIPRSALRKRAAIGQFETQALAAWLSRTESIVASGLESGL